MQIEIKILTSQDVGDFVELVNVFEEVFDMENFVTPDNKYLQSILANPDFLTLVAKVGNIVLGGLTVYILNQYYSKKRLAYIYDVAVLKKVQRQGIGKALINYVTNYCKENDFEEVFVQADRVDDQALSFYRSTKVTKEEDVILFYYSL